VSTWIMMVLAAASERGWRGFAHFFGDTQPGSPHAWGPPRDRAFCADRFGRELPQAAIVRIAGTGADVLFGLEQGLHRFTGLAGEPCHIWVNLVEPKAELSDEEWPFIPAPPPPVAARGTPMRDVVMNTDAMTVVGESVELTWKDLPARLEEAAVVRVMAAQYKRELAESLWMYDNPLALMPKKEKP